MLIQNLKQRLQLPISFTTCHRIPERSFFFRDKQFPLCARCTGLAVGYLFYPFFLFGLFNFSLLPLILLQLPMVIDGVTQLIFTRESTNWLRFVTGLLAGASQVGIIDFLALHSANLIFKLVVG